MISIDNATHYVWGNGCDGWHLAKTANLSVIQERVPCGCEETRHYHEESEQFFFVLSGVASLELNGKTHRLGSHEGLHVPAGIPHQLQNKGPRDLMFIVTSTPPSHGDRIET